VEQEPVGETGVDWWGCNLNQTEPDWNELPLSIRIEYLYKCVNV
jgi:hypothetical protein